MLKLAHGDLLKTDAEAIINTVNCVGVMGKGIALQFKQAFPENYEAYRKACEAGEVKLGKMHVFDTGSMIWPRYIINFPTKGHWKEKSRLLDIENGLQDLIRVLRDRGIESVAMPPLGCGNGGLQWSTVEKVIRGAFEGVEGVEVRLFSPEGAPKFDEMRVGTAKPNMTRGRALVLKLLGLYGEAGYRHSLLEVQKLTYFLQASGENMKLSFVKHHYGPYAENVNHVLQRIEGHYIKGYGDRSKDAEISIVDGALDEASKVINMDEGAVASLDRVSRLIDGFQTPYGLELLSTVHWLASSSQDTVDAAEVIEAVRSWNPRKAAIMKEPHVRAALTHLHQQGWIENVKSA